MKLLFTHPNTETEIYLDGQNIIKRSKNKLSDKVKKESRFYFYVNSFVDKKINSYFPEYLGYFIKNGKNEIVLKHLKNFQNLSRFLITEKSKNISEPYLCNLADEIVKILMMFSSIKNIKPCKKDLFHELYVKRVKSRLQGLRNRSYFFRKLSKNATIFINGKEYPNLDKQFNAFIIRKDLISKLKNNQKELFFHGDLHFENILVNNKGSIKLIDPNGRLNGFLSYDIGKLLHSTEGKYDLIQNYSYFLEQNDNKNFKFKIKNNRLHSRFSNILFKKIKISFNSDVMLQAYFACWCHMASLIVHHLNNDNKQSVAFYLQAVLMGDKFLSMEQDNYFLNNNKHAKNYSLEKK